MAKGVTYGRVVIFEGALLFSVYGISFDLIQGRRNPYRVLELVKGRENRKIVACSIQLHDIVHVQHGHESEL